MKNIEVLINDLKKAVEVDKFTKEKEIQTTKTPSAVDTILRYALDSEIIKTSEDALKVVRETNVSDELITILFNKYYFDKHKYDDRC